MTGRTAAVGTGRGADGDDLDGLLPGLLASVGAGARIVGRDRIRGGVHRLRVESAGLATSVVVKRLEPDAAFRNQMVIRRWLPAVALGDHGPVLLDVVGEPGGDLVWHVYADLGAPLSAQAGDHALVRAAVEVLAALHLRFRRHHLLPACRMRGADRGSNFYAANAGDAQSVLERREWAALPLSSDEQALLDRFRRRVEALLVEQPRRAEAVAATGGGDTLLHGDPTTDNIVVSTGAAGSSVIRLIDWDHCAVGPFSYDLSTFLRRFPRGRRAGVLSVYREVMARGGWALPGPADLDVLFETAELARLTNRVVWGAVAVLEGEVEWGFAQLRRIDGWFDSLEPLLLDDAAVDGRRAW